MRHVTLTAAAIAMFLLAAPALAEGNNGNNGNHGNGNNGNGNNENNEDHENNGNNGNNGGGGITLTTPSPEAAIGLPALALGAAAIVYLRSRRRKAAA